MSQLTKDSTEYKAYVDVWRLFRKHYDALSVDRSDSAWASFVEDAILLSGKYPGNIMCENFLLAVTKTLEQQFDIKR